MENSVLNIIKRLLKEIDSNIDWRTLRTRDKSGFYIYKGKGSLGAFFRFTDLQGRTEHHLRQGLLCSFDYDFSIFDEDGNRYEYI